MPRLLAIVALLWSFTILHGCQTTGGVERSDPVLSPRAFTEAYAEAWRTRGPGMTARVEADLLVMVADDDGEENGASLYNAYREYRETPDRLDEIIRHYVDGIQSLSTYESADEPLERSQIIPIVKDRAYLDEIRSIVRADPQAGPPDPVFETLNDELVILYAADLPSAVRFFDADELDRIGVSRKQLRALAIENMRQRLPEIQVRQHQGFRAMAANAFFEPSLLLLPELWSKERLGVKGEIVVAIPSREYLLIADSSDQKAIDDLRRLATLIVQRAPYQLTDKLFVYRNGHFETYRP